MHIRRAFALALIVPLLATLAGACSSDGDAPDPAEPGGAPESRSGLPVAPAGEAAGAPASGSQNTDTPAGPPPAAGIESPDGGAQAAGDRTDAASGGFTGTGGRTGTSGGGSRDGNAGGGAVAAATPVPTVAARIPANETIVAIPTPTNTPTRTPTPPPTATPSPGGGPTVGGCSVFPSDNAWNTDVSAYPVHPNSANFIAAINATGGTGKLHPDFGGGGIYGIPYIVVPSTQPMTPVVFTDYGDESDPGPYPIPLDAPIEGGSDAHVIAIRQGECKLYELFASYVSGGSWYAASGAVWNLNSNALRPAGWTSADAAGLPIFAGLARYDEVQAGAIRHALRFTVKTTQKGYILPATHWASSNTNPNNPPMGLRLRLKASYDISGYTGQSRVILQALKTYGMIVADNGSNWYITGASDSRWNDTDLGQIKNVPGTAFEVVNTGPVVTP